jgi:hypothetical protein
MKSDGLFIDRGGSVDNNSKIQLGQYDRDYVNETIGLAAVYRVIRDWNACTATRDQPLNGHEVARFLHDRDAATFTVPVPALWRAIETVADEEIYLLGRKPENLVAALIGPDHHLRG